jgi:preprotein translocase subunit YajC
MGRAIVVCGLALFLLGGAVWAQETTGGTAPTSSALSEYLPLIILLVAFGLIFYFMLIRPQRKRQQDMNTLLSNLKRGDKVMTAGGIIGEIDSIGDTSLVITLEEGAKMRVAKMSIVRKMDK